MANKINYIFRLIFHQSNSSSEKSFSKIHIFYPSPTPAGVRLRQRRGRHQPGSGGHAPKAAGPAHRGLRANRVQPPHDVTGAPPMGAEAAVAHRQPKGAVPERRCHVPGATDVPGPEWGVQIIQV